VRTQHNEERQDWNFVNYIKGDEMDKYVARMQKTGNVKERGYLEKGLNWRIILK
jgi:hypothetical protein